ncbi:ABC transporter substrate-binding protein [Anaerococcus sp. NML200574]|uniref:ABC transporter substrate-binding protein n=1 Tax=Anaerococcus sp. NML200574 TaxID=2954486 RepID=UPI00223840F5|nr:ABC transporter substrate-binding protein [Anaerococcus sp. NML200574]MCW6677800.1 ABC transporter substrate-binding protein [Anaerococcus sp. NML200574]
MNKKIITMIAIAGAIFTGCGSGTNNKNVADENTIKIGSTFPLTGQYSNYGVSTVNGIKMAVEEINANGGIDGKKISLESLDDKGELTDSVTSYRKLVESGAAAVIGTNTSSPSQAIAEASQADGIPVITPTGTEESITVGKPNVFRTCFTNPYQGDLLAIYAKDSLKAKTAAILENTASDYSTGIADAFEKKAEELGIEIVAKESYGENDTDFKAQLTTIAGKNPDVLLLPEYYEKLSLITPQARNANINAAFLGGDGWDGILKTMDPSSYDVIENSFFTNHFSIEDTDPKVQEFISKYKETYGEDPTAFSALGYDTVYIIKQGFEAAQSDSNADRCAAIKGLNFKGITGSFTFDENNNPKKAASIMKIEKGEYKFDSIVNPR